MGKKNFLTASIIAVCVLGVGIYFAAKTVSFLGRADKVEGQVTSIQPKTREKGWWVFAQYTVDGKVHTYKFHTNKAYNYPVGKVVPLLYDQSDPDIAKVDLFFPLWGIPACLFFIGLVVPLSVLFTQSSQE